MTDKGTDNFRGTAFVDVKDKVSGLLFLKRPNFLACPLELSLVIDHFLRHKLTDVYWKINFHGAPFVEVKAEVSTTSI